MFTTDNTEGFSVADLALMNQAAEALVAQGIDADNAADIVNNNWQPTGNTLESLTGAVWVMLMNPATGSVDTVANWRAEMTTWETSADGKTPEQQFAALVPVRLVDGSWVEA